MRIEIDQSGRVEYTSHKTVIADSLGNSVYITSVTKRDLQELYRKANKPRLFVYEVFALLIVLLIKKSFSASNIYIIDTEYTGRSEYISKYIFRFSFIIIPKLKPEQISFGSIKEGSKSDKTAHKEFLKITKSTKISPEILLNYLLQ